MAGPKLSTTKNYRLFERSPDNRALALHKHKKLYRSMKQYGFIPCFPLGCVRNGSGGLIVRDGQHRLAIAEELGLYVWYVIVDQDFDVATINDTPKTWAIRDYAETHAANGLVDYQQGLQFTEEFGLPIGISFALLAGTVSFNNVVDKFKDGEFRIKDREYATSVAVLYGRMIDLSGELKSARFLEACTSLCRVPEFDAQRLIANAKRCREKLVSYSTRDAYLDMAEQVYNFGRAKLCPIKTMAQQVMRDRSISTVDV